MKNKLLGKRIFSIILTIAVILSMMPTMVWADSNEANGIATQASIIKNRSYYTDENGQEVELTTKEFDLMMLFVKNRGTAFLRASPRLNIVRK